MNPFRILGDACHTASKCILIWAMHSNKSAEGVSLVSQALYALVFCTRYLDIFGPIFGLWNFVLKIFYILSSLYILFLMLRVFPRTREREKAWKLGAACLGGSIILAPLVMMLFDVKYLWGFQEILWVFSIILESVCILPQLLLLRQTTVPTVLSSFYLLNLGSYRGFYILNWIWRELDVNDRKPDAISIIFGLIQTALYVDFAWVYWGRQRVKLRNGGVVDQDDFSRGWLLTRLFGKLGPRQLQDDGSEDGDREDVERNAVNGTRTGNQARTKWGPRGLSVSADDGMLDEDEEIGDGVGVGAQDSGLAIGDGEGTIKDPDEMENILDEEDEDEDELLTPAQAGSEWRDGTK